MEEKYHKWEPIEGIENEMWVEAIHDDYEGLRILLKGNNPSSAILRLVFDSYYMYRNVDESYRLRLWEEGVFSDMGWSLFRTESSNLIDWLREEGQGVYDDTEMVHYLIKTGADVIEIMATKTPPIVEWLGVEFSDVSVPGGVLVKRGKRGNYFDKTRGER
jgi:hypothetical protein